jgi:hypothetical protein
MPFTLQLGLPCGICGFKHLVNEFFALESKGLGGLAQNSIEETIL